MPSCLFFYGEDMGEPFTSEKLPTLCFYSNRRFGSELEILAFDGKNRPAGGEQEKPVGTDYVIALIKGNVDENVTWRVYEHTHNNDCWVVKPDSSCGLEICTPVYRNWRGIRKICQVVDAFRKDPSIAVDDRCSVHVHIDISDLTIEQLGTLVAMWVKCESVFIDLVPNNRKNNRYCQFLCLRDIFDTDIYLSPEETVCAIGDVKYFTANSCQWKEGNRKTLEFRIIEGEGCKDPYLIKNWLRLILHFVERASKFNFPSPYCPGDQWSWICMLDVSDVLKVLGFYPGQYELSNGLTETRNWMLARLNKYTATNGFRWRSYVELQNIISILKNSGQLININDHLSPTDLDTALYDENYRF